jgi:hypothetical protein
MPTVCAAAMSAMGQKQTLHWPKLMSALPPIADIPERQLDVRFVPKADIRTNGFLAGLTLPDPFCPSRAIHCETVGQLCVPSSAVHSAK